MSYQLPAVIHEGERNDTLFKFACSLRSAGYTPGLILAELRKANCRPPMPDDELWQIAQSAGRYDPTALTPEYIARDAALRTLNRTYAVAKVGGDRLILEQRRDGEVDLLPPRAFRLWLANRFVPSANGDGKRQPIADAWLTWDAERRQYERLVFKPGDANVRADEFNLWRGWAIAPRADGHCRLFLRHLRDVVCGGNEAHYAWLLDWLADVFQRPQRKLGLTVALRGVQGAGKSLVGLVMKKLLGPYQVVAEKQDQVIGRFNGHLARCLLLQAEEAFWGGDRGAGVLKHLVTSPTLLIERKGIDAVEMANYTRLLITSNDDWLWPAGLDDRRLVIFEVRSKHRNDKAYFRALFAELERGGYQRLLRVLLHRKIDAKRLEAPPRTMALEEQAAHTMPPEEIWLRDVLTRGRLPVAEIDADGNAHAPVGALYQSYAASVARGRHVKSEIQFGIFLKRHLPIAKGVEYEGPYRFLSNRTGTRVLSRVRVIASLAKCRDRYSKRGRAAPQTWPKARAWRVEEDA